jgi:hypothetical protein
MVLLLMCGPEGMASQWVKHLNMSEVRPCPSKGGQETEERPRRWPSSQGTSMKFPERQSMPCPEGKEIVVIVVPSRSRVNVSRR